ncbi:DUF3429 domain-containing protein [Labrenzia sp. DG1229]|uniref:DUF3429 domain-containing protein n=1 Tax=Labrenzia sp. DG1229 TaxID=681847 RepID=UPI000689B7C5|nr:DUF3429 domain-containing protein [Labrenzia sp. DG1229]
MNPQSAALRCTSNGAFVPSPGKWLGGAGVVPFLACALLALLGPQPGASWAAQVLVCYGAVILSFLGGIQWGLATGSADPTDVLTRRLGLSVVPSLVGWGALLLPVFWGLLLLVGAFALVFFLDLQATRRGEAPTWFPRLRAPLRIAVMVSLVFGAVASV